MNEVNNSLFKLFEDYLENHNYEIDVIGEQSVRGIKGLTRFHFFYDYKYYEYCMYIAEDGHKKWASIFLENEDGTFSLNHDDDRRLFKDLFEVIEFTESKNV